MADVKIKRTTHNLSRARKLLVFTKARPSRADWRAVDGADIVVAADGSILKDRHGDADAVIADAFYARSLRATVEWTNTMLRAAVPFRPRDPFRINGWDV